MRKTRSIYCSDDEYERIKIVLCLIRAFDLLPIGSLSYEQQSKFLFEIIRGDAKNEG